MLKSAAVVGRYISRRLNFNFCFMNARIDDGEKLVSLETGPANQNTVNSVLTQKCGRVTRFNAATIKDC